MRAEGRGSSLTRRPFWARETSVARDSVLSRLLREAFDPPFERFLRFSAGLDLARDPVRLRLARHREEAMRRALEEALPRALALEAGVVARDPEAICRYDALVSEAMARMRAARPEEGEGGGGRVSVDAILGAVDRRFYKNAPERLDDPDFPEADRREALDLLDRFNQALGTYDAFMEVIAPLVLEAERRAGGRRPVRVHDLASGHAGFAVWIKQRLGDRALVEASDIKPEYLAIGRERAEALGVRVDLFTEDALAMDGPRARGVDVLLCTQALHHFPPGMVARMVGEASRAANVGACFIDGERSLTTLALFLPAATLYTRHGTLVHDGIVSIRRMYYREELGLLAALAPGKPPDLRVETGSSLPAHAYLRITRDVTPPPGARS
jgi:hypothetical protein